MQCPKCSKPIAPVMSRSRVAIDRCAACQGIWFDAGELPKFVKDKKLRAALWSENLESLRPSPDRPSCPRCSIDLFLGQITALGIEVDTCAHCRGIWLDGGELQALMKRDESHQKLALALEPANEAEPSALVQGARPKIPRLRFKIPSLRGTMLGVMGTLYGLLFALTIALIESGTVPNAIGVLGLIAFLWLQFFVSPWIMDWSLRLLGSLQWVEFESLPKHLQDFVKHVCNAHPMDVPRFGIIEDGTPNAFTYGRTRADARLVLTRGALKMLSEKELEAVVAHELGHVYHRDFIWMTVAQMAPILLHQIYRFCLRGGKNRSSGKKGKGEGALVVIGVIAYVGYLISNYLVLFMSRSREYWADHFASRVTGDANLLASALLKIVFGHDASGNSAGQTSVQAFGIFDLRNAKQMRLYAAQTGRAPADAAQTSSLLQWDLWSPWAWFQEIASTHPLPAKRLLALGLLAARQGKKPLVTFDRKQPETYWDEFVVDLFFGYLPLIAAIFALGGALYGAAAVGNSGALQAALPQAIRAAIQWFALGSLIRLLFTHRPGPYRMSSVAALLREVKVSPYRSIPVRVEGTILGRGSPGYLFSEDFTLKDPTGLVFLDYQQPLWIWNLLFSVLRSKKFIDQQVVVHGWFRRGPVPYIEIKTIHAKNGASSRAYTVYVSFAFNALIALIASKPVWNWLIPMLK